MKTAVVDDNADAAFNILVRLSQEPHRKLRDVAHALVEHTPASSPNAYRASGR